MGPSGRHLEARMLGNGPGQRLSWEMRTAVPKPTVTTMTRFYAQWLVFATSAGPSARRKRLWRAVTVPRWAH